jgi:type 1 fimbria pilin
MRCYTMRLGLLALSTMLAAAQAVSAQELDWAQKMFSALDHDFGVVARGADVKGKILVKNLYKEPVTIVEAQTTCKCFKATPSQRTLKTGEVAEIELTMDTKNFMRQRDASLDVRVTFDNVHYKSVRVPLKGYIRSDVVLSPGAAEFGTVDLGAGGQQQLRISYAGRDDWHIKEVRANRDYLKAAVREVTRSNGRVTYDLTVQLAPNAPEGALRDQLMLITDDANNPYVPVTVAAVVEPDIVVATPSVALGDLKAGVEKTVRVVVRGRKPFAIDTIECESDLECFKVKLSQDQKTVHVLPLTVTPPTMTGEFSEEFTVHIAGRDQPIKFRASGRVDQ